MGVRAGTAKLAVVVKSEVVMTAGEVRGAASQEQEHIYSVVEHLMEARCKVTVLVG